MNTWVSTIAFLITFPLLFYAFARMGRQLIVSGAAEKLRTWRKAEGTITSSVQNGPAVFHNPYAVTCRFRTENGEQQEVKTFLPADPFVGSEIRLLYDPEKPTLGKLEPQFKSSGILVRNAFVVKSEKQVKTEFAVYAVLCFLAFAGVVFLDTYCSANGHILLGGIGLCAIFFTTGILQCGNFFESRLQ